MKPVLRCFQISLLAVLLSGAAMAQWEAIGDVKPAERKGNEFTFRSIVATVVIRVLAADLIRVRAVHATSLSPDHSYAVVKTDWPSVTVGTSYDGKYQAIRTVHLEVRVQLSPFRIAFYDAGGALLSKDFDTQGMAWNGNRVRVWKRSPRTSTILASVRRALRSTNVGRFAGDVEPRSGRF
jgi:alpha-glucosidase